MPAGGDGPATSDGQLWRTMGHRGRGGQVASASTTPGYQVTQRDRSCAGKTTERGTETCLNGCREAVTNCGTVPCPGRSRMRKRGDRETCMVKPRGGNARVNGETCLMKNCQLDPSPSAPRPSPLAHAGLLSSPTRGEVDSGHRTVPQANAGACGTLPLPLWERIGSPQEPKAIGWTNLVRGFEPCKA
jgi:hypothetical protein